MVSGQRPQRTEAISNTRLQRGNYLADVVLDTRHKTKIFHWIIQRIGSPEVIHWGQEYTFEAARDAAQGFLQDASSRDPLRKAT